MPAPAWNLMDPNSPQDLSAFLRQTGGLQTPQWGGMDFAPPAGGNAPPVAPSQPALNAALPTVKSTVSRETTKRLGGGTNSIGATQRLLDALGSSQVENLASQKGTVADLQAARDALSKKDLPVNWQALAGLTDAWSGSNLAPNAAPQETEASRRAELQTMGQQIAKAQQGISQDQLAMLKDKLTAQYHAEDIQQRGLDRQVTREGLAATNATRAADKQERKNNEDLIKMSQDLDPSRASSRTGLGVATQKIANAKSLNALTGGEENLTNSQMEELAIGLNKLVSGTSAGAQAQIKALVPETARGNSQLLKQWLTNEPQGMEQQAFVRKLMQTVKREAENATSDIEKYQRGKLAGYGHLKSHPGYENVLKGYEDNYNVSLHPEAEDAAAIAWARDPANAGTPEAAAILKMHGGK